MKTCPSVAASCFGYKPGIHGRHLLNYLQRAPFVDLYYWQSFVGVADVVGVVDLLGDGWIGARVQAGSW